MSPKDHDWKTTLHQGMRGQDEIKEWLESKEETVSVVDVSHVKAYQVIDIDFIWINDGKITTMEIKSDQYDMKRSNNIFLETVGNVEKGKVGCFFNTKSDYYYYYFVKNKYVFKLPIEECREWFVKNMHRFEKKQLSTNKLYHSEGYLIPRDILMDETSTTMEHVNPKL
jgi:hypothetical protein